MKSRRRIAFSRRKITQHEFVTQAIKSGIYTQRNRVEWSVCGAAIQCGACLFGVIPVSRMRYRVSRHSKDLSSRVPTQFRMWKAICPGAPIASARTTRRGHRPWHVQKLLVREPGGPTADQQHT
jgi:hypothetical protein